MKRLDRFSYWTDNNFALPFTRFRFGVSPLIGLIPGVGDLAGLVLSVYVLAEARKVGASPAVQGKMVANMMAEFVGGLLPVVGDTFDFYFKANTRNTKLLRDFLNSQLSEGQPTEASSSTSRAMASPSLSSKG